MIRAKCDACGIEDHVPRKGEEVMKALFLIALFVSLAGVSHAQQISGHQFPAPSISPTQMYNVNVYEPINYSEVGDPYRVLIYLHGSGSQGEDTFTFMMFNRLTALIGDGVTGQIDPIIVVWPGIHGGPYGNRHGYTNSVLNGDYENVIVVDLMTRLEENYNVSTDREMRAIGAFSMGGDGSIRITARHSDMFVAYISNSGTPSIVAFEEWRDDLIWEAPEPVPPYTYDPDNGSVTFAFFGMATAFSPNLGNPPFFVDFPLAPSGEWDPAVYHDRWIANHDAAILIGDPTVLTNPIGMYFDAGNASDIGRSNCDFFEMELIALGEQYPYTYKTFNVGHELTARESTSF
jgi:hypothetical protein